MEVQEIKQKTVEIKEIRVTPNIGDHDFNFKSKNARGFLEAGNKVKYFVNKLELREKEYTMFDEEKINEMLATRKKVGSSNVLGRIFEKFFD